MLDSIDFLLGANITSVHIRQNTLSVNDELKKPHKSENEGN